MSVKVPAAKRGRPVMAGVARPECPKGHEGTVQLNGRRESKGGRFEKTRYRCLPSDRAEKAHDFIAPLAARRPAHDHGLECESCERPFERTEGLASGWRYAFAVREVAEALVRAGRGGSYREISADLRRS